MTRGNLVRATMILMVLVLLAVQWGRPLWDRFHPRAGWPAGLILHSAPVGEVYHIWAGSLGQVIAEVLRLPAWVEVTGGPLHNVRLVQSHAASLGFSTNASLYKAWHGQGMAEGVRYTDIRAIFPMYSCSAHWYALAASGITSASQLAGKRVGVGPAGDIPATYFPLFLEALGIRPSALVNGSFAELTRQLLDGRLDAVGWIGCLPMTALTAMEEHHPLSIFGFTGQEIAIIAARYPFVTSQVIRAGTYRWLTHDIRTLAVWNLAIAHREMDDDLVYAVVKAAFAHRDRLVAAHPTARELSLDRVPLSAIPYHPGAVRYFRQRGVTIPAHLLPPGVPGR